MDITGTIVVFIVLWWLIFFMALPFGVRGQWEGGEVTEGTEAGAPIAHGLGKKALATTAISLVLLGVVWLLVHFGVINMPTDLSWE